MPRTEKENAKIRERRRNEILDAAVEIFAKKGYEKTSCDDINKKVGCSHGLFYRYFKSKDDIYNGIVEKYKDVYLGKTMEIAESGENAEIIIRRLIKFFVDIINKSKKDAYIMFIVLTSPMIKGSAKKDLDKQLLQGLVQLIMKIRFNDAETDAPRATSLALCFYYMLLGMCYTKINYATSLSEKYFEVENVFLNFVKSA